MPATGPLGYGGQMTAFNAAQHQIFKFESAGRVDGLGNDVVNMTTPGRETLLAIRAKLVLCRF